MERKIEIAREIAQKIANIPGVFSAEVDDYNKQGSFQLVVVLNFKKVGNKFLPISPLYFSLHKIGIQIKKILNECNEVSNFGKSIEHPSRTYYRSFGQCAFDGYDRSYTMVDFVVVEKQEQVSISELVR